MNEEKYLVDYIDQLTKSIDLYKKIISVVDKINYFNRHCPIDWDQNDVFGILEYLYDNAILLLNNDSTIRSIIKKNFDELFNNFMKDKLEEIKDKYTECINILGKDTIYNSDDTVIYLSDIVKYIDNCIHEEYNGCYRKYHIMIKSTRYIKYTDDDITIIKGYIFKIRKDLEDIKNNLKLPNKKDYEL